MNLVLRSILAATLAFSISCSSGGGGGDGTGTGGTTNDNTAFKNVAGSILGQWAMGDVMTLFISETRLKLVAKCENNQSAQAEVGIKLSPNTITFLESKAVGTPNCSIDFKKDAVMNYSVNGDNLTIQGGEEQMSFTRIQSGAPANPGNGGGNPGGGTQQGVKLELFSSPNCTGQKLIYTQGMNCNQLSGNVQSLKQVGGQGQCQNTNTPQDSRALCNTINQQLANQGRQ